MLVAEVRDFARINSSYMTERTNQWLMDAVSQPNENNRERYYYDYEKNELFAIYENDTDLLTEILKDKSSQTYSQNTVLELKSKLSKTSLNADIIEIPRMPLEVRKAIQTDFIFRIENFKFFDAFSVAIRQQDQTKTFVLDNLLSSTKGAFFFIDYWAEFKAEQLLYFINEIEDNQNVNLQNATVWQRPEWSNPKSKKIEQVAKNSWWKLFN